MTPLRQRMLEDMQVRNLSPLPPRPQAILNGLLIAMGIREAREGDIGVDGALR